MRAELAWSASYVPVALVMTLPLLPRLGRELAGDGGDGWQNLWNLAWVWRSLWHGASPLFTQDLHHPHGISLVFQTFDWPDAVLFAPVMAILPPVTVYGLVVMWTFVASGVSGFVLGRLLGVSRPAAFVSGAAFTFSTFHFGHALGHLHILAMQWLPLFAAGTWRAIEGRSWRWGVVAGVAAGLAGLSSWYHLMAAVVVGACVLPAAARSSRGVGRESRGVPGRAGGLSVRGVAGPLALAILDERAKEPVSGAHSARTFSADVESFLVPNGAQALGQAVDRFRAWSGNAAENASYLGWVLLLVVGYGAVRGAPRVRAWCVVALAGIVLSMGPALRLGGIVRTGDVLPYAWLERVLPFLSFTGVPVRLGVAATLGLAAALGPALDLIASRRGWRWAGLLGVMVVAEHWPHAFVTSSFALPAPVASWASDPERWAVLDATRDSRHLWHQLHHQHPIIGGYTTRTPARLEHFVTTHPVAGPLLAWDAPVRSIDIELDSLQFRDVPPIPGIDRDRYSFDVRATFDLPAADESTLRVTSDDGARAFVDGRLLVDNGGTHPERRRDAALRLPPGRHELRVTYDQSGGAAMLSVESCRADACRPIEAAFPGLRWRGAARVARRAVSVSRDAALERLRGDRIRKVVVRADESTYLLETQLGLVPEFVGDGVRIYEVPGVR